MVRGAGPDNSDGAGKGWAVVGLEAERIHNLDRKRAREAQRVRKCAHPRVRASARAGVAEVEAGGDEGGVAVAGGEGEDAHTQPYVLEVVRRFEAHAAAPSPCALVQRQPLLQHHERHAHGAVTGGVDAERGVPRHCRVG